MFSSVSFCHSTDIFSRTLLVYFPSGLTGQNGAIGLYQTLGRGLKAPCLIQPNQDSASPAAPGTGEGDGELPRSRKGRWRVKSRQPWLPDTAVRTRKKLMPHHLVSSSLDFGT